MPRRRALVLAATLAAVLLVASGSYVLARTREAPASGTPIAAAPPPTSSAGAGTGSPAAMTRQTWKLTAFTFAGQPQTLVSGITVTLTFFDPPLPGGVMAGGNDTCNAYGVTYSTSGEHIHVQPVEMTQRACNGMLQEAHYLEALGRVTTYHLDGSVLTLQDDAGQYVLRYVQTTTMP